MFYGQVKNLRGAVLQAAVTEGLKAVNLLSVGNQLVSSYSGGMKRRLSVAVALMGDPLVVYLVGDCDKFACTGCLPFLIGNCPKQPTVHQTNGNVPVVIRRMNPAQDWTQPQGEY
jgi:hypothetical protein